VVRISAGADTSALITESGKVWSWGNSVRLLPPPPPILLSSPLMGGVADGCDGYLRTGIRPSPPLPQNRPNPLPSRNRLFPPPFSFSPNHRLSMWRFLLSRARRCAPLISLDPSLRLKGTSMAVEEEKDRSDDEPAGAIGSARWSRRAVRTPDRPVKGVETQKPLLTPSSLRGTGRLADVLVFLSQFVATSPTLPPRVPLLTVLLLPPPSKQIKALSTPAVSALSDSEGARLRRSSRNGSKLSKGRE
jgi:hypothetical protein